MRFAPAPPILSALLRELPWTHNLSILGKAKRAEEREFYLRLAVREKWSSRELDRQLDGCLFERVVLSPPKLSPAVRVLHPGAQTIFKDTYLLDFLNLPEAHSEADLQKGLQRSVGVGISIQHLWRVLKRLGARLKKSHFTPPSKTPKPIKSGGRIT